MLWPWLMVIAVFLLLLGWAWGLGFAPADAKQRDGFRIIYFHVPAAMWSMGIYALMAVCAFVALVWQNKPSELLMMSMAPIGATFTFIALGTGSIWGKVMWNTWWEWDARMTSELILLFLYLGAIGLYHTFDNHQHAGRIVAILLLVGVINLPIIHFSVEWWQSLHQASTQFHNTINSAMRVPLRIAIFGYMMLFMALTLVRFRTMLLQNSIRRNWQIEQLLLKGGTQ
nr:heme ABC transporter permease CcmC [Saezia sanguinis]